VADLRASVPTAFQHTATDPGADVFRLEILVARAEVRLELSPHSLTLNCLLFAGAAPLGACVSPAVQAGFADSEALRGFNLALVADCSEGVTAAAAVYRSYLHA
jgi:hypothetical protein